MRTIANKKSNYKASGNSALKIFKHWRVLMTFNQRDGDTKVNKDEVIHLNYQ